MNQILVVENNKKQKTKKIKGNKPVEIKGIVKFFAIFLILFGAIFIGQGSYAIYKDIDDRKPANIPTVTISRINDKAIIYVKHNVEISKIVYSWNNGEDHAIPVGDIIAEEEITLLGYDSILNLTVEDINGKKVKYQKQYILNDVDITKPTIEIKTEDGNDKMTIIAKDEKSILYLAYQWEGEEVVIIDANEENQKEIEQEIPLTVGTKKIKIIAVDENNNYEEIEKEIVTSTSKPKISIIRDGKKISIKVEDKDGIKKIVANLNGEENEIDNLNRKEATVGYLYLREGNNTLSVEVTNINGYTEQTTTELQYNP